MLQLSKFGQMWPEKSVEISADVGMNWFWGLTFDQIVHKLRCKPLQVDQTEKSFPRTEWLYVQSERLKPWEMSQEDRVVHIEVFYMVFEGQKGFEDGRLWFWIIVFYIKGLKDF